MLWSPQPVRALTMQHKLGGIVDQDQSQTVVYRMVGRQFSRGTIKLLNYSQDISHGFILDWNLRPIDLLASIQTREAQRA